MHSTVVEFLELSTLLACAHKPDFDTEFNDTPDVCANQGPERVSV